MTREQFQEIVVSACSWFSMSETSGHRTVKRNKKVGGAPASQHLGWKCVDLVPDDLSRMPEVKAWLEDRGLYVEPLAQAKHHIHTDDRFNAKFKLD